MFVNRKSVTEDTGKKTDIVAVDQPVDDVTNGISAYKSRDAWRRRPATSPERKVIISKVKNERIISRNQTTSAIALPKNGNLSTSYQTGR